MSEPFDKIEKLLEQLRGSLSEAGMPAPDVAQISDSVALLARIVGACKASVDLQNALRQKPIAFSHGLADSLEELLADARKIVRADPTKLRTLAYRPNEIPLDERWGNLIAAAALLGYGALSIQSNDVLIPARYGQEIHFHGMSVLSIAAAVVCGASILLLTIIDHYDRRDNERYYRLVARILKYLGVAFLGCSFLVELAQRSGLISFA